MFALSFRHFLISFLAISILTSQGYADETRLENDKLIFSNGGGFQNEADVISVLNIGKSGTYLSKGVNIVGDYITVDNDIQDLSGTSTVKNIGDRILLKKLTDLNMAVFRGNGQNSFPTDVQFVIGDCSKKYLVMSAQKIGAIKVTSPATGPKVHSDDILYIQKNKAPTYIGNVTNPPEIFTPAMSIYGQLVINGILADVKRVGINTKDPSEALTIVGDLKVDGKLNASTGIFRPRSTYPTAQTPAVTSVWTTVASNTIKVKYASHGVFVMGNADVANMGKVEARILIKEKALPSSVSFTDFHATPTEEEASSVVIFTGSSDQWLFSLYPIWTGKLPAFTDDPLTVIDESTLEKEYQIELQTKFDVSWTGTKFFYDPPTDDRTSYPALSQSASRGAQLTILGLPDAPFKKNAEGSLANEIAYTQSTFFSFNPIDGNFLTKDLLGFKTDGFIMDSSSGLSMLFGSGTKFKPFRASKINASNLYEQQFLKVFAGSRVESVFKITNPEPSNDWITNQTWLGISSNFPLHDVSHNIQSIYSSGPVPLWLTQANIGDGALTMNPDETEKVDSVGIGTAPVSEVALSVQGNVSFTGQYIGNYGRVLRKKVPFINARSFSAWKWTTLKGVSLNVTVDKASSVMMMSTMRFQNYEFIPPIIRGRLKYTDENQNTVVGPISQCAFSSRCKYNSVFLQLSADFLPGKTYKVETEIYLDFPSYGGELKDIYDAILVLLIIPSVAE